MGVPVATSRERDTGAWRESTLAVGSARAVGCLCSVVLVLLGLVIGFAFGYSVLTGDSGQFDFREWGDVSGGMLLGALMAEVVVAALIGLMIYGIRKWFPTKEQREYR